jgi:hypothetical protein
MPKKNVASGNDVVAVQVGTVRGRSKSQTKSEKPKAAPPKDAKANNVRSGNAQVGVQADEISNVTVVFGRHR